MSHFILRPIVIGAACCLPFSAVADSEKSIEEVEVLGQALKNQGLSLQQTSSTASRLGLSIQDVPASISVIDKESIALKADFSALAAVSRATGFSAAASPGNGGSSLSVRGFSGNNSVMTLYDGNRIFTASGTVSFPIDTWTIERIEVLRGASSVINGMGAIGATVNYISKKPTFDEIHGELALSYGSDNSQRYAVGAGGQMTDSSAFRVDVAHFRTDGYVDGNQQQRTVLSNSYLIKAQDNVDILVAFDYAKRHDDRTYYGTPLVNGKIASGTRKNNYNADDAYMEFEDFWPRINLTWQINENIQWHSNLNYLHSDRTWLNIESYKYNSSTLQVDLGSHLGIRHKQEQLGTRHDVLMHFDLSERFSNRLNIGIELNDLDFGHYGDYYTPGFVETPSSTDLYHPTPGNYYDAASGGFGHGMQNSALQYALFVDHLLNFDNRVYWSLGFRRDAVDFKRNNIVRSGPDYSGKLYSSSWRTGLVYKPIQDLSLYLQYDHSVEAMGALLTLSQANLKQKPMTGKQYEIGLKHQALGGSLQYSIALFSITKNNLLSADPNNSTISIQIGEQRSRGIEVEGYWQPIKALRFDGNATFTKAEYIKFQRGTLDYSGKSPTGTPRKTANFWATWFVVEPVSISAGARYVGRRFIDFDNGKTLPSYIVYDANINWQVSPSLKLSLHGKNLENNSHYVISGNDSRWLIGDGRTFEASLHYTF